MLIDAKDAVLGRLAVLSANILRGKNKPEYTLRSLNSIIKSLNYSKEKLPKISFDIVVVDHNSKSEDLQKIKNLLKKSNINNSIINLDVNEFSNNIKKINAKNENVTDNQIGTIKMTNDTTGTFDNTKHTIKWFEGVRNQ